jgi:hypothetical protein
MSNPPRFSWRGRLSEYPSDVEDMRGVPLVNQVKVP